MSGPIAQQRTALTYGVAATLANRPGWNYANESLLQQGVEDHLIEAGYQVRAEVVLDAHSRIDFMVYDPRRPEAGEVGIECKIRSPLAHLRRQVHRYAAHPDVHCLLVVTTDRKHEALPREVIGVPVHVLTLGGIG